MPDVVTNGEDTAPADDIRSALLAAVDEQEKAAEPEKPAAKPAAEAKGDDAAADPGDAAEPEPKEADAAAEADAAGKDADAEPSKDKDKSPREDSAAKFEQSLSAWKPADRTMFKSLAPEAQEFLMRRHKEMEGDYTKKLQGVARLKTEYEPVDKLFEPHRDLMRQKGFTPASLVEAWKNVEEKLAGGEDSAARVVAGLVQGYNIPVAKIAAVLGIRAGAAQPQPQNGQNGADLPAPQAGQEIQLPADVLAKLSKLDTLERTVTGLTAAQRDAQQRAQIAAEQQAEAAAQTFRSAKDAQGNLLRPHIDEVEGDMLAIAQGYAARKQPVPPLEELYETAVWANPSTREKLRTAETQAADKKRADQERAKAKAAKSAAVSVTGAPGAGQAPQGQNLTGRSLREELEASLADQASA